MGKTEISPVSASVPVSIRRWRLGVEVLNWYPNRKPSEEMRRTTGRVRLVNWRRVDSVGKCVEWVEEKRRKAKEKAAERERQRKMRREMKRMVGLGEEGEERDEGEWVLKERRDLVGSSSTCVGLIEGDRGGSGFMLD